MNARVKSTAILMALILTLSVFTSLAATNAVAAATTTPAAEAATNAVATPTPAAEAATNAVATPTPKAVTITLAVTPSGTLNPGQSFTLYGYVRDGAGTPVANSNLVEIDTNSGLGWTYWGGLTTDANGRFSFTWQVDSASFALRAQFLGPWAISNVVNITVEPRGVTTLSLSSTNYYPSIGQQFTLSGYLRDSEQKGIPNKPIQIWIRNVGDTNWALSKTLYTGTDGRYSNLVSLNKAVSLQIQAVFPGDSSYDGYESNIVTLNEVKKVPTTTTITASNTNPTVGQTVTFTVNLKSGTTGLSKSVKIWHTTNGVRWEDGTRTTTNGVYSFTQAFGSPGQRIYHAEFAGDSSYASSSGAVTVNVGTAPKTTTTITASTTTPKVGQTVTFTVNLKSGTTGLSKSVKIWHTTDGVRWEDGTRTTTNGVYTFTQAFSIKGQRIYHAEFAGDSQYAASSGAVTVNVGSTSITLTVDNPTPTVGRIATFTATLKSGTTPLSGKSVTIYHYINGVKYLDTWTARTTNAAGKITFMQSFSSPGPRTYYATFAGDSTYGSSTSKVLTITPKIAAITTKT